MLQAGRVIVPSLSRPSFLEFPDPCQNNVCRSSHESIGPECALRFARLYERPVARRLSILSGEHENSNFEGHAYARVKRVLSCVIRRASSITGGFQPESDNHRVAIGPHS
jgi:hypothetical protein